MSNPFRHDQRRTFSDRERAQFFADAGGKCKHCGKRIPSGMDWHIDHEIPIADGGTNDDVNLQVLCYQCHSLKTKEDVAEIAKGKRSFVKAFVPRRERQSKGWRR